MTHCACLACLYVCMCLYFCVCTFVCVCLSLCVYVSLCVCVSVCICLYVYACVFLDKGTILLLTAGASTLGHVRWCHREVTAVAIPILAARFLFTRLKSYCDYDYDDKNKKGMSSMFIDGCIKHQYTCIRMCVLLSSMFIDGYIKHQYTCIRMCVLYVHTCIRTCSQTTDTQSRILSHNNTFMNICPGEVQLYSCIQCLY